MHPYERSFAWADSYALVLLLVVVTYVVSVSVTETWAASIVLTVQLATVWLTLRISHAPQMVRLVAAGGAAAWPHDGHVPSRTRSILQAPGK